MRKLANLTLQQDSQGKLYQALRVWVWAKKQIFSRSDWYDEIFENFQNTEWPRLPLGNRR